MSEPWHTQQVRQSVPGLREDGRWVIAVNHIAITVVILVVAGLLAIAATTATSAQESPGLGEAAPGAATIEKAKGPARAQALSGFGLLGIWVTAGAVGAARANPGRKLTFGSPPPETTEPETAKHEESIEDLPGGETDLEDDHD